MVVCRLDATQHYVFDYDRVVEIRHTDYWLIPGVLHNYIQTAEGATIIDFVGKCTVEQISIHAICGVKHNAIDFL